MTTRVLAQGTPVQLGKSDAPLSFYRPEPGNPEGLGARTLRLDSADAFSLTFWCGTCPLIFERLGGANRTMSKSFQARLNDGMSSLDEQVISVASLVVPDGTYMPLLLEVQPELVLPSQASDYFAHEQVAHDGIDVFWGLPHHPKTPYYRGGSWKTGEHDFLFEFVVPMVPPSWNDQARVSEYEALAAGGVAPTVLALSILDHTQPFDSPDSHSGLLHFVLDGHHKLEAAARAGASVRMLSLLSLSDSLSSREQLDGLANLITKGRSL